MISTPVPDGFFLFEFFIYSIKWDIKILFQLLGQSTKPSVNLMQAIDMPMIIRREML
jgi:hypothetical protein